jgi:hypothetical protein
MINLIIVTLIVLVLNMPFGYWRANVRRFSLQWYLAIHVPVLFIIGLRLAFHLGFAWYTYVILVSAFFLGQQVGGLLIKKLRSICDRVSSCMVMDLYRCGVH